MERLKRQAKADLGNLPGAEQLNFRRPNQPKSILNAMAEYQAMMDAIRDGPVNKKVSDCPGDPVERAKHLKSFGYFQDASMIGICRFDDGALLNTPWLNQDVDRLANDLKTRQTKTLASGIDVIMANFGGLQVDKAKFEVLGNQPEDVTASGLWPSDHAGVGAKIEFEP